MKIKISKIFVITLLCTSVFFSLSCMNTLGKTIKNDNTQFPSEFGKDSVFNLLVQIMNFKKFDKYLTKNFKENYTGEYTFINSEEIESKRFEDLSKYRYIFYANQNVNLVMSSNASGKGSSYSQSLTYSYSIKDRISGKIYTTKISSGAFSAFMKAYIIQLEIIKNQNRGIKIKDVQADQKLK